MTVVGKRTDMRMSNAVSVVLCCSVASGIGCDKVPTSGRTRPSAGTLAGDAGRGVKSAERLDPTGTSAIEVPHIFLSKLVEIGGVLYRVEVTAREHPRPVSEPADPAAAPAHEVAPGVFVGGSKLSTIEMLMTRMQPGTRTSAGPHKVVYRSTSRTPQAELLFDIAADPAGGQIYLAQYYLASHFHISALSIDAEPLDVTKPFKPDRPVPAGATDEEMLLVLKETVDRRNGRLVANSPENRPTGIWRAMSLTKVADRLVLIGSMHSDASRERRYEYSLTNNEWITPMP